MEGCSFGLSFTSFFSFLSDFASDRSSTSGLWAPWCLCQLHYFVFLCVPPCVIFSLSLRRPILLCGLRVGPVAWPWRAGSSPALPPRPYVARPLANRLTEVEVMTSCLYFSTGQKGWCEQHKVTISTEEGKALCVVILRMCV